MEVTISPTRGDTNSLGRLHPRLTKHGKCFSEVCFETYDLKKVFHEMLISTVAGLNIDVHEHEVDLADSTFRWPESGLYFTGLEVYHSLHCLVRQFSCSPVLRDTTANKSPSESSSASHVPRLL
jgi:hypothetical protein